MMKRKTFKLRFLIGIPLLLVTILFGFYVAFEFTLVAEIKESLLEINKEDPIALGKTLFETRGCAGCHSLEQGVEGLGPSLYGLTEMNTIDYIRESITRPNETIVEGYKANIMPDYGKILEEYQVEALIEYLGTL